ncbi:MAG: calcium-translocating P-type ATPase, SERCA-type [Candidatus Bathyarchaeia archaeon]
MAEVNWHTLKKEEVLSLLKSRRDGLRDEEAEERLMIYGPNELRRMKGSSPLKILLDQFKDLLISIILFATAISYMLGEVADALVIFAIVVATVVLGFVQEYKAERATDALRRMIPAKARVLRGGEEKKIDAVRVVPGDILLISSGDRIVADGYLLEDHNLQVDEAPLTGEAVPVEKEGDVVLAPETPLGDRVNCIFSGTTVTYGHAVAVVTATGMNTQLGKIAGLLQEIKEEKTPLEKRIEHVGRWLAGFSVIVVMVVSSLGVLRGYGLLEMFLWGVSLLVAAVPEALPAIITGGLAIGMQQMAKRKAIVRKLRAVEALGSIDVICSDKTGTLTKGEMTVKQVYAEGRLFEVKGVGYDPKGEVVDGESLKSSPLPLIAVLCNNARLVKSNGTYSVDGQSTEGALIVLAKKIGISVEEVRNQYPKVGEIPFSSNRKCMSTIHATPDGRALAFVKGAPEVVIARCNRIHLSGGVRILTEEDRREIYRINDELAKKALRTLALAYKEAQIQEKYSAEIEEDLIFCGLVGMIDPPREEAKDAVQICKQASIKTVMVTGDHKLTANAIAQELGILDGLSVTGDELDRMSDNELDAKIEDIAVFSRVSPEHKLRIVKSLKKRGHIVAVTGDGVNDAPALRRADIGVAMGITGTDVSKEAADVILMDDNFATIVAAVLQGRVIYENIKKYLAYLVSKNLGEILIMLVAALIGMPLPLLTAQILWVNLVTDGLPAMALGVDPPDPDVMNRPPRPPRESIFAEGVKAIILVASVIITMVTLPIFGWYLSLEDGEDLAKARTIVFTLIVMFGMFNAFNCRSIRHSIFKVGLFKNRYLLGAVASSTLLQIIVVYVPLLQPYFGTVPLDADDWLLIGAASSTVLLGMEMAKALRRNFKRFGTE